MRLALAQLEIEAADVDGNVDRAVAAVERAADEGADLIVLPELFTVGYFAFESYHRFAEPVDGETLSRLAATAAEKGVAVLAGSIVEDLALTETTTPASTGLANTSVFLDRSGERRAIYRKRHLFGYGSAEEDLLTPGSDERLPTVSFEGFEVGIATCYDMRFPEQFRRLVDAGVTFFAVPSAWPYPRVEHWSTLAQARAIENLAYVGAANGSGTFEDQTLLGRSTVYDPWGTVLAGSGDDPTLVTADLDPDRVRVVREEFPALSDRR